jgi:hypothetical protein
MSVFFGPKRGYKDAITETEPVVVAKYPQELTGVVQRWGDVSEQAQMMVAQSLENEELQREIIRNNAEMKRLREELESSTRFMQFKNSIHAMVTEIRNRLPFALRNGLTDLLDESDGEAVESQQEIPEDLQPLTPYYDWADGVEETCKYLNIMIQHDSIETGDDDFFTNMYLEVFVTPDKNTDNDQGTLVYNGLQIYKVRKTTEELRNIEQENLGVLLTGLVNEVIKEVTRFFEERIARRDAGMPMDD